MESVKVKCIKNILVDFPFTLYSYSLVNQLFNILKYIKACPSGYFGSNCSSQCPYPSFGLRCVDECNCNPSICDPRFGCRNYGNLFVLSLLKDFSIMV